MSDTVTKEDLKIVLREHTDEILGVLDTFMERVDERFTTIKTRLDEHDKKI